MLAALHSFFINSDITKRKACSIAEYQTCKADRPEAGRLT